MKRKDFIKQSSASLGALLLTDHLFALNEPRDGRKINLGIIGCGNRGVGLINLLKELKDKFTITALCDVFDFRIMQAREVVTGNVPGYKDYRKLLDDKNVHAVVIASPLYLHFEMASAALDAGRHVYLEKTMTYNINQALDLVKIAKSRLGQVLQIGHQLPYTPLYIKVRQMIEQDYLGKITQVDCRYDRHNDWRKPVTDPKLERAINWRMYKQYSGGLTAEILSHQMQFINWALDTHPDEVFSTGGIDYFKDGRETYDNVQVMLRYSQKNLIGNFGSTLSNEREGFIFKIKGSKGTVELLFDDGIFYPEAETRKQLETVDGVAGATKIEWKKDGGVSILKEKMKDSSGYALEDFYRCITQKKRPIIDVNQGAISAITVALANLALYGHSVQQWKSEYNIM